jgi:hypothetical protein
MILSQFAHQYKNIIYVITSTVFFIISFLIIELNSNFFPLWENTVTDYVQDVDLPFLKDKKIFFDLSYSLIFFIIIFYLIDQIKNNFFRFNLKIIFVIKSFFSLFIIIFYERNSGLDQNLYYDILSNKKIWVHHFGYLPSTFEINNGTNNFLLFYKYLFFLFSDSWFLVKIYTNLFYIGIVYFSYKIFLKFNNYHSLFTFYFISLIPSIFIFSSIMTKDIIILFFIQISLYQFINILDFKIKNKLLNLLIILFSIMIISLIRSWIGFIMLLSFLISFLIIKIKKNNLFSKYNIIHLILISILLSLLFYFFIESSYWILKVKPIIVDSIYNRIYSWQGFDSNHYKILGYNSANFQELLFNELIKMMFLTLFNPFLDYIYRLNYYPLIIENLLFFFIILFTIFTFFKHKTSHKIYLFLIVLLILYSLVYSYAGGFLNPGTSFRYATQVRYPILIVLFSINFPILKKFYFNREI